MIQPPHQNWLVLGWLLAPFPLPLDPRCVLRTHTASLGHSGPVQVQSRGTWGCCPPSQAPSLEFCHWSSAGAGSVLRDRVFREQRAGYERFLLCGSCAPFLLMSFLLWGLDKIFGAVGVVYRRNVRAPHMNFKWCVWFLRGQVRVFAEQLISLAFLRSLPYCCYGALHNIMHNTLILLWNQTYCTSHSNLIISVTLNLLGKNIVGLQHLLGLLMPGHVAVTLFFPENELWELLLTKKKNIFLVWVLEGWKILPQGEHVAK